VRDAFTAKDLADRPGVPQCCVAAVLDGASRLCAAVASSRASHERAGKWLRHLTLNYQQRWGCGPRLQSRGHSAPRHRSIPCCAGHGMLGELVAKACGDALVDDVIARTRRCDRWLDQPQDKLRGALSVGDVSAYFACRQPPMHLATLRSNEVHQVTSRGGQAPHAGQPLHPSFCFDTSTQAAFDKAHQAGLAVYDDPPSRITYPCSTRCVPPLSATPALRSMFGCAAVGAVDHVCLRCLQTSSTSHITQNYHI
jgi:hypothetical protein